MIAPSRLAAAAGELRAAVDCAVVPGAVAAIGVGAEVCAQWVEGDAEHRGTHRRAMRPDTVFDLASLTKVTATLPAVACLVRDDALDWDDAVCTFLPEFGDTTVTLRHLLAHIAGLAGHRQFYLRMSGREEILAAILREGLDAPPGTQVVYSDLGFMLLGAVVGRVTGEGLDGYVRRAVFGPLGMEATFNPPISWRQRCAATEVVDGAAVLGRVHDENAAAAGGVCGHSGLFATVADLQRYVVSWLDEAHAILPAALRRETMRCQTDGLGGARALGWTCRGDRFDILSAGWGPAAVSHTGFTGTSIAVDPVTRRWAVLLTNAVHFGRSRPVVRTLRERFHAALVGDELPPYPR